MRGGGGGEGESNMYELNLEMEESEGAATAVFERLVAEYISIHFISLWSRRVLLKFAQGIHWKLLFF
jgi:hypothetical protein